MAFVFLLCRRFFAAFFVLLLLAGLAVADTAAPETGPTIGIIYTTPMANPGLNGRGILGPLLGLPDGIFLGGMFIPQFNWTISGGTRPHTTFGSLALGLDFGVDSQKILGIPGGTFGMEFVEYTGGATNTAAACVQLYDGLNDGPPHVRQELYQLWWHQRLFEDKLIFQIGKMNAGGIFDQVQNPVPIDNPKLQDTNISVLTSAWPGLNPTQINRMPIWPNTAYGVAVTLSPIKNLYASYGIFDNNNRGGAQTGLMLGPRINNYKFNVAELGASWLLGEEKLPGRFGIGGWWQTGKFLTPYLNSEGYPTRENGAKGYYLFANQRLWYRQPDRDNSGLISYLQFGHTSDGAAMAKTYVGAGLTGVSLLPEVLEPVLPYNRISFGMAWSALNNGPLAGLFFFPPPRWSHNQPS